jgi:hypothetical protein
VIVGKWEKAEVEMVVSLGVEEYEFVEVLSVFSALTV